MHEFSRTAKMSILRENHYHQGKWYDITAAVETVWLFGLSLMVSYHVAKLKRVFFLFSAV